MFVAIICVMWLFLGQETSGEKCKFAVANRTRIQNEFIAVIKKGIQVVYIDYSISEEVLYQNRSRFDRFRQNGLLRWIYTKNDLSYILSYTEDFPVLTFNLLDGVFTEHLTVPIEVFPDDCDLYYGNDTHSMAKLTHETFMENQTNVKLCHRYFKNQNWKLIVKNLTNFWVGFDMECYDQTCLINPDNNCQNYFKKSSLNYIIIFWLFFILLYGPLLLYFLPDNVPTYLYDDRINHYTIDDTPYSFKRIILRLNKPNSMVHYFEKSQFSVSSILIVTYFVIGFILVRALYFASAVTILSDIEKY